MEDQRRRNAKCLPQKGFTNSDHSGRRGDVNRLGTKEASRRTAWQTTQSSETSLALGLCEPAQTYVHAGPLLDSPWQVLRWRAAIYHQRLRETNSDCEPTCFATRCGNRYQSWSWSGIRDRWPRLHLIKLRGSAPSCPWRSPAVRG